ncbi:sulfonate ABC transporter substrate-binding protein [Lichenihabitans sp. PAMC28606]|uniref:sulfonate ABC transporter substrate-binding protein n=1 Tax=Lichenihabitans sp. PAMC28606 TaxID=2880932 RepID=UPI001D0A5B5C|nr:sulfonate ABC transporter substrate-binding protein [Lichenihabitans sp. PAMC28606]UDL94151.1 sulfonate ABC transporter substrate-binding protein [Lichenihabitans sp. PAMC28606]
MVGHVRFIAAMVVGAATLLCEVPAHAADPVVRIGYQKYGTLILLKSRGELDAKLKAIGYGVTWTEFPAGPQLLEGLNAGAIDIGATGEAPPIFAQAAGVPIVYVASEPPAPLGEAILVPKDSTIRAVSDLKGKSVALNKGSNVHYLLVKALERAGVAYTDIKPVFLAPADARAAFERGSVDAWAIWDPYYAAGQVGTGARTLVTGTDLVPNAQFYLASKTFSAKNAKAIDVVIAALDDTDQWVSAHQAEAAAQLSDAIHIPASIIATALGRQSYGVARITTGVAAEQQKVADAFATLGLLPKSVSIADAIATPVP